MTESTVFVLLTRSERVEPHRRHVCGYVGTHGAFWSLHDACTFAATLAGRDLSWEPLDPPHTNGWAVSDCGLYRIDEIPLQGAR